MLKGQGAVDVQWIVIHFCWNVACLLQAIRHGIYFNLSFVLQYQLNIISVTHGFKQAGRNPLWS
jgi:hypothetical protein